MKVLEERLGMSEGCVQPCDERCTPQVCCCPTVWGEFGWGRECECVGLEEGEEVNDEESSVRSNLEG